MRADIADIEMSGSLPEGRHQTMKHDHNATPATTTTAHPPRARHASVCGMPLLQPQLPHTQ